MTRTALVLGATGLVGGHCLEQLRVEHDYERIQVLSRRPVAVDDPRVHLEVADLEVMAWYPEAFAVTDVFCCLGTTLARAGSRQRFYHVDHNLCVEAAQRAAAAGARNFLMVSAVNARRHSPFFYARTKGRAEADVAAAGVPATHFFRPSLLLGAREENRPAEWLGIQAMRTVRPAFHALRSRLTPVAAEMVAAAMISAARADRASGIYHYRYRDFLDWSVHWRAKGISTVCRRFVP